MPILKQTLGATFAAGALPAARARDRQGIPIDVGKRLPSSATVSETFADADPRLAAAFGDMARGEASARAIGSAEGQPSRRARPIRASILDAIAGCAHALKVAAEYEDLERRGVSQRELSRWLTEKL